MITAYCKLIAMTFCTSAKCFKMKKKKIENKDIFKKVYFISHLYSHYASKSIYVVNNKIDKLILQTLLHTVFLPIK